MFTLFDNLLNLISVVWLDIVLYVVNKKVWNFFLQKFECQRKDQIFYSRSKWVIFQQNGFIRVDKNLFGALL